MKWPTLNALVMYQHYEFLPPICLIINRLFKSFIRGDTASLVAV